MGYRSDVRIIVSGSGYKELCEYVKRESLKYANNDYDYNLLNHADNIWEKDKGDQVMIGWDYIKWYDPEYKDVKIIEDGLNDLTEKHFAWRFSRIGESYDDIEERYNDSELDQDLDWPSINRYFDDEYNDFELKESNDNES